MIKMSRIVVSSLPMLPLLLLHSLSLTSHEPLSLSRPLETVLPVLKKLDQPGTGKGKGKDATAATSEGEGSSSSNANGAAPSALSASSHVLVGRLADGKDPLEMLRPESKTVGYLHIL